MRMEDVDKCFNSWQFKSGGEVLASDTEEDGEWRAKHDDIAGAEVEGW